MPGLKALRLPCAVGENATASPLRIRASVTIDLGQPTDRKPPFKFSASSVGFSDTDAQGIVLRPLSPYFDLARVEYERHLGLLRTEAVGRISS